MFSKCEDGIFFKIHKGISLKTSVYGENMLQSELFLEKGAEIPVHDHIHEQTGYLVSGLLDFSINGKSYRAKPGDSWSIPSNVKHGAKALEESVVIEVFSPVREEYLY